ncbi:MAG TPA: NAD(P)-binding domain-containing protein [Anaerolineales bacterium]|jgi:ornithine cyclodeaminase/alanine dehydrogenase-like protein (mu-crystallin family)|nr:NAD(P)-binding domain-containing protein [Anaerolineales bacterium]
MLILTSADVRKALPMNQAIEAMKQAYASLSEGKADVPLRARLPIPAHDALSLIMPAYVQTQNNEALAVKAVSLFPQNPSRGLAYIQAAVLLLDSESGRALALLEGSTLTAIRTGAAGGASVDLLSRKESRTVAIFGAGVQGRTQLEAACAVRKIEKVFIFDPNPEKARAFANEMAGQSFIPKDIQVAKTAQEAAENADIVCTATTSSTPVFEDKNIKPGTHIAAVGSYTPDMQEIPAETLLRAKVVIDSRAASLEEAGDLIQPLRAGVFDQSHVHAELGEIALGRKSGRETQDEITYFKSVGIAAQDAVAAQIAFKNAEKMKIGHKVDF